MKRLLLSFLIIPLLVFGGTYLINLKDEPLADDVLRLHVIANSDDPRDQAVKLEVKDHIVAMMHRDFSKVDNAREARRLALREREDIKAEAESVLAVRGYHYPVQVYIGEFEFPTKSYGNVVLPQGEYQAVRVVLGEGQGKNWWCVLFPPLCMVSSSDKGLALSSPQEAEVSLKCLELLPRGMQVKITR
ncbi:MAG: stage II sporulation protein R [Deltaproteobacteria bacterium]